MSRSKAPEWQHASQCGGCKSGFGMFNRKHHCRNCGGTFCGGCSGQSVALPHYGFVEPQRVCKPCYKGVKSGAFAPKKSAGGGQAQQQQQQQQRKQAKPAPEPAAAPAQQRKKNCTCGLPFCICPDEEEPEEQQPQQQQQQHSSSSSAKRGGDDDLKQASKSAASHSSSSAPRKTNMFFNISGGYQKQPTKHQYDLNGDLNEQCREAVKAGDADGVKQLLEAGANAKYVDRSGNSLLHLAAMFNRLDLVTMLMRRGANPNKKNTGGETAIDVAPPSLQFKMKELMSN